MRGYCIRFGLLCQGLYRAKIHHHFLTFSLPQRHKDTKGHKGHIFFIPKIKSPGVPLCPGALVVKIRRLTGILFLLEIFSLII
jgi:hypothetical protein